MSLLELVIMSVALGTDLFSVAVPIGVKQVRMLTVIKAALVFSLFHIIMILTGYHIGHSLGLFVEHVGSEHIELPLLYVKNCAAALGAMVLVGLGIRMLYEQLHTDALSKPLGNPLKGITLVILAISVSIDALAAGFGMGMMDVDLILLSIVLGIVIFIIAVLGLKIGKKLGCMFGARACFLGGILLVFLGVHLIWMALFS